MEWSKSLRFSPTEKHDIRSISKSVISLLIGAATADGIFPALDLAVLDYLSEYSDLRRPGKDQITFRHLLTMSQGLKWDEHRNWSSPENNERQLLEASDPCRYVLQQPMAMPPGIAFRYCGGATTLLAAALSKAAGCKFEIYARDRFFDPLGIVDLEWLNFAGAEMAAGFAGLRLRPRDLAKLGQLVVAAGQWRGKEIMPASWISESTEPRMNVETHAALFYGYHWWLGRSLLKGRELSWIAGFGAGGQRLFIVPALDLVLAVNAFNYKSPIALAILNRIVLPAVMDGSP
jgi:CubicO group peptidase (beta-lactamase class C family)